MIAKGETFLHHDKAKIERDYKKDIWCHLIKKKIVAPLNSDQIKAMLKWSQNHESSLCDGMDDQVGSKGRSTDQPKPARRISQIQEEKAQSTIIILFA